MVFPLFVILLSRRTVIKPYKNRDGIQKIKSSCIIIIINSWLIILNLLCTENLEVYIFCRIEKHVKVVECNNLLSSVVLYFVSFSSINPRIWKTYIWTERKHKLYFTLHKDVLGNLSFRKHLISFNTQSRKETAVSATCWHCFQAFLQLMCKI